MRIVLDLDGIFPRVVAGEPEMDISDLHTEESEFVNYHGVEQDDDVNAVIQGYVQEGYLRPFHTLQQVTQYVGAKPVLTKVGAVKKEKTDASRSVITKCRIIVDSKQAGTSLAAKRTLKSNLPRVTQAVRGILGLMKHDYAPIAGDLAQYVDAADFVEHLHQSRKAKATKHAEQQCARDVHFAQCETPTGTASNYAFV